MANTAIQLTDDHHDHEEENGHVDYLVADQIIVKIPPDISAEEQLAATMHQQAVNNSRARVDKGILTTILTFFAAGTGLSIFAFNDPCVGSPAPLISLRDVLLHPRKLPDSFYAILCLTVAFTVNMVGLETQLWFMITELEWPSFFKTLLLVGVGAFGLGGIFFGYAFMVNKKVPQFTVTASSVDHEHGFKISSFWLVWLYGLLAFVLSLIVAWLSAKLLYFANQTYKKMKGDGGRTASILPLSAA